MKSLVLVLLLVATPALAAGPTIGRVWVTDVTPHGFSLVVTASEPCDLEPEVFRDAGGTERVLGLRVESMPGADSGVAAAARARGITRARVSGLTRDSQYHVRARVVARATGTATSAALVGVRTEREVERARAPSGAAWSNHLVLDDFYDAGGEPALGALVLAEVAGGASPLAAFVGAGAAASGAVLDLNNLFSASTRRSLEHAGGETLTLTLVRGPNDVRRRGWTLPAATRAGEVLRPQPLVQSIALLEGWNLVALQLEPADAGSLLGTLGSTLAEAWGVESGVWKQHVPGGVDTLGALRPNRGYLLLMNAAATLTVRGPWQLDPVALAPGWNFSAGTLLAAAEAGHALEPLLGSVRVVWGFDAATQSWNAFSPAIPPGLNDLEQLEPGRGYYVDMTGARLW